MFPRVSKFTLPKLPNNHLSDKFDKIGIWFIYFLILILKIKVGAKIMDENNESFFGNDVDPLPEEPQSANSTPQLPVTNQTPTVRNELSSATLVEPIDELQIEIDNSYKVLIDSIVTARQACNKLKERKSACQRVIDEQKSVVQALKQRHSAIDISNQTFDENDEALTYKENIKQTHCVKISSYAENIAREVDSNPINISYFVEAIREELNAIEAKEQLIASLEELDGLYQDYKRLQQQSDAAEKRFQNALAIFGSQKS